jgi:guanidinopropionase
MIKKIESYPELVDPQLRPRYSGIPTFFRTPYTTELAEVDIGLVGVPFDGGVTNRTGARHGPRDIRNQSSLIRKINQATGVAPFDLVRVADLGDAWIERPFELQGALGEITGFFAAVHSAGVTPLSIGGDHSISLPIVRAITGNRPLGVVHIDAHCDTGDDYLGSRFHHGAPFRRAVEEDLIDPKHVIQIGIRGSLNVADMWQFIFGPRLDPPSPPHSITSSARRDRKSRGPWRSYNLVRLQDFDATQQAFLDDSFMRLLRTLYTVVKLAVTIGELPDDLIIARNHVPLQ